jgi:hypothetical protein
VAVISRNFREDSGGSSLYLLPIFQLCGKLEAEIGEVRRETARKTNEELVRLLVINY